ncbi:hypothetical protein [Azospirillum sp. B510]|uniref:hypothetical protein n=1 Tax=Azospirillum sp. (strain B510) TaxID=137722 RepID=UPI0002DCBD6C|nr:hypothetical protein [Azospirillum sp. B510]
MHSVESQITPSGAARAAGAATAAQTTTPTASLDVQAIADRYGWTPSMARWWMSFAACSVGNKSDAMIAFLDKTVGGVAMIRRR